MSRYLSAHLSTLAEYVPGEQLQDRRYIKLNTNESPYPASDGVVAAVDAQQVRDLRLYPDTDCRALKKALAETYGVGPENIFVSNGSDDILNFAFMGYCGPDRPVIFPQVSYGFYQVYADLYRVPARKIPMEPDFSINPAAYLNAGCTVVLANPNAQTGVALPRADIERIVASNPAHVVLIDEAYVDFGGESAVPLTKKYKNLLVCQTFSKSRSLAGARLGFAVADAALIADLDKIRYSTNPYNINRLTQAAGTAALHDAAYYAENCRKIVETRDWTKWQMEALGFFVTRSSANFLLCGRGPVQGAALYVALRARGILVRHFSEPLLDDYVRITIGTAEDMRAVVGAVREIVKEAQA